MLARRIIPCFDVKCGRVVKGTRFIDSRDAGDAVELAAYYDTEGADELVFLDIMASYENRNTLIELARRVAERIYIPFTIGGGVSSVDHFRDLLNSGAEKVAINTAAHRDPSLISRAAEKFGSQCVVVAIDARRVISVQPEPAISIDGDSPSSGVQPRWEVFLQGGRTPTGMDAVEIAVRAAELGAGEILLTSMDTDGVLTGYDLELTRAVAREVPVPVIASGGAGTVQHIVDAFTLGEADAALVASVLHYGMLTLSEIKESMKAAGLPVRMIS